MTIDEGLNELARQRYSHTVDVVEGVMTQVMMHPYLQPVHRVSTRGRWLTSSVAAVIVMAVVGVAAFRIQANNEAGIGSMISQVQDYDYYGTAVEEAALNPIECIYEGQESVFSENTLTQ